MFCIKRGPEKRRKAAVITAIDKKIRDLVSGFICLISKYTRVRYNMHMKRVLLLILLITGLGVLAVNGIKAKVKHDLAQPFVSSLTPSAVPQTKHAPATGSDTTSLFVPYWTMNNTDFSSEDYDAYLYFGVTPTKDGLNTKENGYVSIEKFVSIVPPGKDKILVLRMLEADINTATLRSAAKQKTLIRQTLAAAKEYGFDGVVLDLELSAIPFDSLIAQIRDFNSLFYDQTKAAGLSYGIAIYGDTFYRLRPFDVKAIAKDADMLYVMAYDFHKSRGNPGPNFPLSGKETYGYDISEMSEDFLRDADAEKVTVVFGLFGYDWKTDNKGNAIGNGDPLAFNEISSRFLNGCKERECTIARESKAGENQIRFIDEENAKHVVWFEDMDSVTAKQVYLRSKGINNFSFWANSYF